VGCWFTVVGKCILEFGGDSKGDGDGCVIVVISGQLLVAGCINECGSKGLQVMSHLLQELQLLLRGSL